MSTVAFFCMIIHKKSAIENLEKRYLKYLHEYTRTNKTFDTDFTVNFVLYTDDTEHVRYSI